ncbi:MAG: ribbon-helix-helix protein, CopG family [Ilumatobacteraceae bacterium]
MSREPKTGTSVRLPGELAAGLDALAAERGLTTSQCVRELVAEALRAHTETASLESRALVERLSADVAEVRRRLTG